MSRKPVSGKILTEKVQPKARNISKEQCYPSTKIHNAETLTILITKILGLIEAASRFRYRGKSRQVKCDKRRDKKIFIIALAREAEPAENNDDFATSSRKSFGGSERVHDNEELKRWREHLLKFHLLWMKWLVTPQRAFYRGSGCLCTAAPSIHPLVLRI